MPHNPFHIFLVFLKLGFYSFGGPIAHIGYFKNEFVDNKKWLSEAEFSEIVTLCQFLPGPASSQTGIAIGFLKGRYLGAISAWLGFTLPSAAFMLSFAIGFSKINYHDYAGLFKGLTIAGCAVVLHACYGMINKLCPDISRKIMAVFAVFFVLLIGQVWAQYAVIVLSGLFGFFLLKDRSTSATPAVFHFKSSKKSALYWLIAFFILLFSCSVFNLFTNSEFIKLLIHLFNTGSTVFGGGHIVLPLLQNYLSAHSLISNEVILSGYGLAQALPGPLFTFSAFVGASLQIGPHPVITGILCCLTIFLPSFFLVFSALPFWQEIKRNQNYHHVISGINAGVVGLLLAVLYDPLLSSEIQTLQSFILFIIASAAIFFGKTNVILTVVFCAASGYLFL